MYLLQVPSSILSLIDMLGAQSYAGCIISGINKLASAIFLYAVLGQSLKTLGMMQFIYDIWYAHITPDRDFPREIRHILNWGFGELAARARRLDVADLRKMLLRSVSSLPC